MAHKTRCLARRKGARARVPAWVAVLAIAADAGAGTVYLAKGSVWRLFPGTAEASSPDPAAWRGRDFDVSAWAERPAPFGYGEPELGTDLSTFDPPMRRNYTTVFLRTTFSISDPARLAAFWADVSYDDGFLMWVNGVEVLRENVGGEPGTYVPATAVASTNREALPGRRLALADPAAYLVPGVNVVAVQAINQSLSNTDFFFDLALDDPEGPDLAPPHLESRIPRPGITVRSLTQVRAVFSEPVAGIDAADLVVGGVPAATLVGAGAGPYVFGFPQPAPGEIAIAWAPAHGIRDGAETPNVFEGDPWLLRLDPDAPLDDVVMSELMASNGITLEDEDGDSPDWVELWNRGTAPIDLGGWSLTDDPLQPGTWSFPARSLAPQEFLVIFASGKDRRSGPNLHTNFKLNRSGEYLGLYNGELPPRAVHEFAPMFPEQRDDYSYGLDAGGRARYFLTATPGRSNAEAATATGFVEDPVPSFPRGTYSEPFDVHLATPTEGAAIFYRTDPQGRALNADTGTAYAGPVRIAPATGRGAVLLRAIAYKEGLLPSEVVTATYLFPEYVLTQGKAPEGFPSTWGNTTVIKADYEIDPRVIAVPESRNLALHALAERPSISIVMDIDDMFSPARGIYSNGALEGILWERPVSAELIYPDGRAGCAIECGLRIQGGTSTDAWKSPKLSMRLLFKDDYGSTRLRFPLFDDSPVREFDTIILDAHLNHVWHHPDTSQQTTVQYVRDTFVSDVQNAMGSLAPHDIFVNLYINGVHWGMYDVHERPDEDFQAAYLGGVPDDYDVLKHNPSTVVNGTAAAFTDLLANRLSGLSAPASYERLLERLDALDFADYMILNLYAANNDWSHQNWYAGRDRVRPGALFRFFSWDAEHVLDLAASWDEFAASNQDTGSPWLIFNAARQNAEFKLLFADRVHRHFLNGGVLYVDPSAPRWNPDEPERTMPVARYMRRIEEIDALIVMESARWGDYRRPASPYTRADWLRELNNLLANWFPQRSQIVLSHFKREGLYPAVAAPSFSRHGGTIEPGFALAMTAGADATIHYTVGGSDPRTRLSGDIAPSARVYTEPVVLSGATHVKARSRKGTVWSALAEAEFSSPSPCEHLRVTEVMYHPPPEGAETSGDDYEFLELKNAGPEPLDLSGAAVTGGIRFVFPEGTVLEPGGFAVLAANPTAFALRYPACGIAGVYAGRLANDGDAIALTDAEGIEIAAFAYADRGWWPASADGRGRSLVPVYAGGRADLRDPACWRTSATDLGSPGGDDGESVPEAPAILRQPHAVTAAPGARARFSVLAFGAPDPAYQWQRNEEDIPGARGAAYTTPPLAGADDGATYRCTIRNAAGAVVTDGVAVTVAVPSVAFLRGDANGDGRLNVSDAVTVVRAVFGAPAACADAADADDDGTLRIDDAIVLLGYMFAGGPPPAPPFPACGGDATPDALGCDGGAACR